MSLWTTFGPNAAAVAKAKSLYGQRARAWSGESPERKTVCFVGRRNEAGDGWDFLARGPTYGVAFQSAASMHRLTPSEVAAIASSLTPPRKIAGNHSASVAVDRWPHERSGRPLEDE